MNHMQLKRSYTFICKIACLVLLYISILFLVSCSKEVIIRDDVSQQKEDNKSSSEKEKETLFYVKYEMEVNYSNANHALNLQITYMTETGSNTITKNLVNQKKFSWDGIYGPFKKSEKVSLDCNTVIGNNPINMYKGVGDYFGRIYVKEGDGEYTIKAEGVSSNTNGTGLIYSKGLHLTYTL